MFWGATRGVKREDSSFPVHFLLSWVSGVPDHRIKNRGIADLAAILTPGG